MSHSLSGLIYLAVYALKMSSGPTFYPFSTLPKPLPHSLTFEHFEVFDSLIQWVMEQGKTWPCEVEVRIRTLTYFTQASLAHCNFPETWGEKSTIPIFFSLWHSALLISGFQICHVYVIGRPLIKCANGDMIITFILGRKGNRCMIVNIGMVQEKSVCVLGWRCTLG